jgi:hypothetical protein
MTNLERGSASMTLTLLDGRITVRHGEDGSVLFDSPVAEGTWDAVWLALKMGELAYDLWESSKHDNE